MKNKIVTGYIYVCILLSTGCFGQSKTYWSHEKHKLEECRGKWIYQDLQKEQQITVLLFFSKFNHDIYSYPNFLIGITETNDTIAFLDKDFQGKIEKGNKIMVLPLLWSDVEKTIYKPLFTVSKKSKVNDLYCDVKGVYYGKIEIVNAH